MTRRIPGIPVLPALSFLFLVTVVTLWARSPRHADVLMFYTPAAHPEVIASDHSGLLFCKTDIPFDSAMGLSAETLTTSSAEFVPVHDLLFGPANQKQHLFGFRWAAGTVWAGQWTFGALIVPYWALVIPLAILPLRGFRRVIARQRRKRRGRCLVCGYDLRQTSSRCPECGTPIGDTSSAPALTGRRLIPAGAFSWLIMGVLIAVCASALVRGRRAAAIVATAPPEQAILGRVVGPIDLQNPSLLQSAAAIARAGSTPIELSGINSDLARQPGDGWVALKAVNLDVALRVVCDAWSYRQNQPLQLRASGRVVRVSPASQAPAFLRSYPVAQVLDQMQSELDRETADDAARIPEYSQQGGAVGSIFVSGRQAPTRRDVSESLASLINHTILVDQWLDNGGTMGGLWIAADRLWVMQTQEGHAAVRSFLALLESAVEPTTESAPAEDHANLDQLIPEVKLESTTLEAAIDTLREQTHSNIVVYWDDLEAAGVNRDAPIKLHLWNVSLGQALDVLLTLAGGDHSGMRAAKDGIIIVATPQKIIDNNGVIKIYDIRDLVEQFLRDGRPPGAFTQPAVSNPEVRTADTPASSAGPTFGEMVESITRLIEDAVDTDSWKDNGGSTGAMRELAGRLIITQTPSGHRQIVNLLGTLRAGVSKESTELPSTKPATAR